MAMCPQCGEEFVSLSEGQLCPDCRPLGMSASDPFLTLDDSNINEALPRPLRTVPPLGVALLAIWEYLCAAGSFAAGLAYLVWPSATTSILQWFDTQGNDDPTSHSFSVRLGFAAALLLGALLLYFLGRGLWTLKNWARMLTLFFSGLDLIVGGPPSKIVSRTVSLVTICYLLTPGVKAAFASPSRLTQTVAGD
jgi:hypothetical protein